MTTISQLEIDTQTFNLLGARGLWEVEELDQMSDAELLAIKMIGPLRLADIRDAIDRVRPYLRKDTTPGAHQ